MMHALRRIGCWIRGYHIGDAAGVYKFGYDVSGVCHDCGIVGSGRRSEDGE